LVAEPAALPTEAARPWSTVWVWALAFMPWVVAGGVVLALAAVLAAQLSISTGYPEWIWVVALSAPYLVTMALAALDAWQLRGRQHPSVAPWAWSLLGGPVYLVARSLALHPRGRRGLAPMWVGLVNAGAATLAVVVGVGMIVALAWWFLAMMAESMGATLF
jgi:hypothetical protein